jgi:hypothetical protein
MSTGSCLCSKVKYTFTGEPLNQVLSLIPSLTNKLTLAQATCHCNECHKVSGSAFTTNLIVPITALKITSGAEYLKSYPHPHQTGMTLTIHFCSNCGSTLYKEGDSEALNGTAVVQAGSIDQGVTLDDLKVSGELFVSQRAPWVKPLEGAGQLQTFS